jgi:predicted nuclease of predicted toxin-antitoxin system
VRRVLFDEDVPRQLRRDLPASHIRTAQEEGWSAFKNGELLSRAAADFDVLLTADKNLQYQQNLARFDIGIVVIGSLDTRLQNIRTLLPNIRTAIENVAPGSVIVVGAQ